MDILRKELDEIYHLQHLDGQRLNRNILNECCEIIRNTAETCNGCLVITDAASDHCYVASGYLSRIMGWSECNTMWREIDSSDEDFIYGSLHPEDLPEKRLLEYEFLKKVHNINVEDKLHYVASCKIRILNREGKYVWIANTTRIMRLSPNGGIWLILCSYDLATSGSSGPGISPCITNIFSGERNPMNFQERKTKLLTPREKEILTLIRKGDSSKLIADRLQISINTVNRHRQNIIEKLSVANSYEAITAAISMNLI